MNVIESSLLKPAPQPSRYKPYRGHPKGLYVLASTEVWERFGYHGMRALLVFLLVTTPTHGGFGWSSQEALSFYGSFTALVWLAPLFGGAIADRIGVWKSVAFGCSFMGAGYLLLGAAPFIPSLATRFLGDPISTLMLSKGVTWVRLSADRETMDAFARAASILPVSRRALLIHDSIVTYELVTLCTSIAFGMIIVGSGLFKSNIAVLLGRQYVTGDSRREAGFTFLYSAINLGGLLAYLFAGGVGERWGWRYAFLLSGCGMGVGLFIFLSGARAIVGARREGSGGAGSEQGSDGRVGMTEHRNSMDLAILLATLASFVTIFWVVQYQSAGLLNLLTFEQVDRRILGFTLPAAWFQMFNPLFVVALGPAVAALWRCADGGRLAFPTQLPVGLLFSVLALAVVTALPGLISVKNKAGEFLVLVAFYLFQTIAELCIVPNGLAVVTRVSPWKIAGLGMGAWLLTQAAGSFFAGSVGALSFTYGFHRIFLSLIGITLIAAILSALLRAPLRLRLARQLHLAQPDHTIEATGDERS